jgi:hypothetical protein
MMLGSSIANYLVELEHMETKEIQQLRQFHKARLKHFPAKESAKLLRLQKILLKAAGEVLVIFPFGDPGIDRVLSRGLFFEKTFKKIRGDPGHCHGNAARQWYEHRNKYRIVEGYALFEDGLWRQHTWLIDNKDNAIETTFPRQLYFGAILDEQETLEFAFANIEDDRMRFSIMLRMITSWLSERLIRYSTILPLKWAWNYTR